MTMASRTDSPRTPGTSSLIAAFASYRPPAHHWDEVLGVSVIPLGPDEWRQALEEVAAS